MIDDLNSQTGMTFMIIDGKLEYSKDSSGNPLIAKNKNGGLAGSQTARDIMIGAIGHAETVNGAFHTGIGSAHQAGIVSLNVNQIQEFIDGTNNLDSRTQGFGMTFMHEVGHSVPGGSLSDTPNSATNPGPNESRMNQVRAELNSQGENYGQRIGYESIQLQGGVAIIPFSISSHQSILSGSGYGTLPHIMYRSVRRW